jgi:hypothetical protein
MTQQELQAKIDKMRKGLENPNIQGAVREQLQNAIKTAEGQLAALDVPTDKKENEPQIIIARSGTRIPAKQETPEKRVSFSDYPLAAKFMPKHQKNLVQRYEDDDKKSVLEGIEKNLRQLGEYGSQDGKGREAVVYAHYFWGNSDWFITETDFDENYENLFGFNILNGDAEMAELGATALSDLVNNGRIELDFYWTPVTLREALHKVDPDYFELEKPENKEKVDDKFDISSIPHTEEGYQKIKDHISQNRDSIPARDLIYFGEVADNIREHLDKIVKEEPVQMAAPIIEEPQPSICNVTRNLKQNGIEIKFPKQPSDEITTRIKAKGFRWSKFQKIWYVKYSESLHQFAIDLCGDTEHSDNPATMPLHAPGDVNVRLITLAVLTSRGKVPQGILRDEIKSGKMEVARYKRFDGMTDSTDYINDNELQWSTASLNHDSYDMKRLKNSQANSHWTDSIYLNDDGTISYGDYKFRYKTTVKGHDYQPKAERTKIQDTKKLEADIQKQSAAKVVDLDPDKYHVPFNRPVQKGDFQITDAEMLDPKDYLDKGEMDGITEIDGYRLVGRMEAKNIVISKMIAVFGGASTEIKENRWVFKAESGTATPGYLSLWSRYRVLNPGEKSDFPQWRVQSFPTAVWESLKYAAREAVSERLKMNEPKKTDRGKKIHEGKMTEALKRVNLIKRAWVDYEATQPGLLIRVTGQTQDEYDMMIALWRKDLGLREMEKPMVIRASGADQDEKHTAQLRHETLAPLTTKIVETEAAIATVTEELQQLSEPINPASIRILGKKRSITLPNGEKHDAQYAIVELDSILASHNEETFADTAGYPLNTLGGNLNDRNYATDKGAQQLVEEYARSLNPDLLISLTSTPDGTPIITPDGIVVSGNNRTMSLKLARKKYTSKWKEYQSALQNDADVFGFDKADWDKLAEMTAPVLVRIDSDFGELTTTNMAKYNASAMKAKSPVDKAVELATTLREQILCETNIPKIIGDFDTLSDFYADRNAIKRMVSAMQQCSVLNEQDMPAYLDGGYFTEDGKTLLETILASLILEPNTLRIANRDGIKSFRQAVVNALPVLTANKNLDKSATLIPFINKAIRYQGEVIASGLSWENFVNQLGMFTEERADCNTVYINRLMNEGQRIFREAIRKYNDSQSEAGGNALFESEVVAPEEAFKGYIISKLSKDAVTRIERYCDNKPAKEEETSKVIQPQFSVGETAIVDDPKNPKLHGKQVKILKSNPGESRSHTPWYNAEETTTGDKIHLNELALKKTDDKKQLAQTRLKLLEKAVNRLEGDKKKLAATRIKLLSKFLQK